MAIKEARRKIVSLISELILHDQELFAGAWLGLVNKVFWHLICPEKLINQAIRKCRFTSTDLPGTAYLLKRIFWQGDKTEWRVS